MRRALVLAVMLPGPGMAQTYLSCEDLAAFAALPLTGGEVAMTLDEAVSCTRSIALGGARSVDCGWGYAYRSDAAKVAFDALVADVTLCSEAIEGQDQAVSHPDSYDLRQFELGDALINVSLKDKAALEETYVFLRAEVASQ